MVLHSRHLEIHRHTKRCTHRLTQTHRHTDRHKQTHTNTDTRTDTHTNTHTHIHTHTNSSRHLGNQNKCPGLGLESNPAGVGLATPLCDEQTDGQDEQTETNDRINDPRTGLTVESSQLTFLLSSKSRDTESKTNIKKSSPIKFRYCALV